MKKWLIKLSLLILSLGILGVALAYTEKNGQPAKESVATEYLETIYFSEQAFYKANQLAGQLTAGFPRERIKGGIIPHDLRHAEYIAHFFKNLKTQSPQTILLIGPNHKELGNTKLITASQSWYTPFGVLENNEAITQDLLAKGIASDNGALIEQEHSISGIIPFIAYYLPQARVAPLIFKSSFSLAEMRHLVDSLTEVLSKSVVVVAAVDFSHYLTSSQAEEKDKITRKALEDFDDERILSLGKNFNDYVDSPPSLAFLMQWMENQQVKNVEILANTNAGKLEARENEPTTSYFEAVYY